MINKGVTDEHLAETLNLPLKPVRNRLLGITEFKRSEMLNIKRFVFPDYTLDQIFNDEIDLIEVENSLNENTV